MSQDDSKEQQLEDSDVQSDSDSDSPGSERVSTSDQASDNEEETNNDFMDFDAQELRSIRYGVRKAELEKVDTILRQQHPWTKDVDDPTRDMLRFQLFQRIIKLCDWLDQKYSYDSPGSYVLTRDLFKANPQLVLEIDKCWCNPESSFLLICNLGEYFWDNSHSI